MSHTGLGCTAVPLTTLTNCKGSLGAGRALRACVVPLLSCRSVLASHRWRERQAPTSVWAPSAPMVAAVHGAVFLETHPADVGTPAIPSAVLVGIVEGEADWPAIGRRGIVLALCFALCSFPLAFPLACPFAPCLYLPLLSAGSMLPMTTLRTSWSSS